MLLGGEKLSKNSKTVKWISTFFITVLLIVVGVTFYMKNNTISYTNPIGGMSNIGDPFILKDGKQYYMYATSEATYGFKVWKSTNLVDWEEMGDAYDHYVQDEQWAYGDFWAPEVVKYKNQYYMTYSARNEVGSLQISIAVSKDPLGPFKDLSTQIIPEEGSYIDGHIFFEDDGTPFLYYVKDCSKNIINGNHVSQIFVSKMNKDLTNLEGQSKLILEPDQEWEGLDGDYQWNEGPYLLKKNGKYYLMYSANFYASPDYSVGYAVSDNPLGPFKKAVENPILKKNLKIGVSGPGHNSVTIGPDDKTLYIVYHIHTDPNNPSGDRQMAIDKLTFDHKDRLEVIGPTKSEQKIKLH